MISFAAPEKSQNLIRPDDSIEINQKTSLKKNLPMSVDSSNPINEMMIQGSYSGSRQLETGYDEDREVMKIYPGEYITLNMTCMGNTYSWNYGNYYFNVVEGDSVSKNLVLQVKNYTEQFWIQGTCGKVTKNIEIKISKADENISSVESEYNSLPVGSDATVKIYSSSNLVCERLNCSDRIHLEVSTHSDSDDEGITLTRNTVSGPSHKIVGNGDYISYNVSTSKKGTFLLHAVSTDTDGNKYIVPFILNVGSESSSPERVSFNIFKSVLSEMKITGTYSGSELLTADWGNSLQIYPGEYIVLSMTCTSDEYGWTYDTDAFDVVKGDASSKNLVMQVKNYTEAFWIQGVCGPISKNIEVNIEGTNTEYYGVEFSSTEVDAEFESSVKINSSGTYILNVVTQDDHGKKYVVPVEIEVDTDSKDVDL